MVSKTIIKLFSWPYYFFYYGIIINSMRLADVRATSVALTQAKHMLLIIIQ